MRPFVLFLCVLLNLPLFAQWMGDDPTTQAELLASRSAVAPGERIWLSLKLEMADHWHTYWKHPGDSGLPTTVAWELPEGVSISEIHWPTPQRFVVTELVSYGYENTAHLLMELQVDESVSVGETLELTGKVDWLECKEICVPGAAELKLSLPVVEEAPAETASWLAEAQAALPKPFSGEALWTGDSLQISDAAGTPPFRFFPEAEGVFALEPELILASLPGQASLSLAEGSTLPERLNGVLVDAEGQGYELSLQKGEAPLLLPEEESRGVLASLFLALLAGLSLNLMPCIFPVLGLKVSSFVEQAQGDHKQLKLHALIFAGGILISMWILGAVVGALGAAWGAQFQEPNVVIGLLLGLTLFTMNLFGVFEFGHRMTTVGGDLTGKQGYAGSFFQGVLLTVIGTPCTGPVMAVMIGWMLTQPLYIGFLAFTLLGVGLALPYVILAFTPALVNKLPPPGLWMVTFKQAAAFMLVLFLWGLLFVLSGQIGGKATVQVAGAMLLVCFASWVFGTWGAPHRKALTQKISGGFTLLLLALALWMGYSYPVKTDNRDALQARIEEGEPIRWSEVDPDLAADLVEEGVPLHYQPWSPERVAELQAQGKRVFVDFTADWCTQCKVNKIKTLHKEEVMKMFQEGDVVTLQADWTSRDESISKVLAQYGRRGVPAYLLYDGTAGSSAELLSESLSTQVIREALQ